MTVFCCDRFLLVILQDVANTRFLIVTCTCPSLMSRLSGCGSSKDFLSFLAFKIGKAVRRRLQSLSETLYR